MNREDWLSIAVERIRRDMVKTVPPVSVSVGFPSRGATARKRRVLGECWSVETTADQRAAVFVSPVLGDAGDALGILLHELCHAIAGHKAGHGKRFQKICRDAGLEAKHGSWKSAGPTTATAERLATLMPEPYPHAAVTVTSREKKQGTRMLKVMCPRDEYLVRITRKWLADMGAPTCPCGGLMVEATGDEEKE